MNNIIKIISAFTLLLGLHSTAAEEASKNTTAQYEQRQIEASECIAFYKYGEALTKDDVRDHNITHKFKSLKKFLRKQLKLDVGADQVEKLKVIGRNNLKHYMEEHDHIYTLKHDGHATELLDLFKRYNPQCQTAIKYYQTQKLASK